jgi:hypothetical protein
VFNFRPAQNVKNRKMQKLYLKVRGRGTGCEEFGLRPLEKRPSQSVILVISVFKTLKCYEYLNLKNCNCVYLNKCIGMYKPRDFHQGAGWIRLLKVPQSNLVDSS